MVADLPSLLPTPFFFSNQINLKEVLVSLLDSHFFASISDRCQLAVVASDVIFVFPNKINSKEVLISTDTWISLLSVLKSDGKKSKKVRRRDKFVVGKHQPLTQIRTSYSGFPPHLLDVLMGYGIPDLNGSFGGFQSVYSGAKKLMKEEETKVR
ncbi:hypothetical protein L6452_21143 [Arctium lappa]|uniref:Uncharacterized protein n=1 Tax=Arctium lappa TaxID=4217 RepID=A0ACB9BDE6_ARCLA|nr:hypothetical protein L6452_21143 [Arctium lappa]